MSLAENPMPQKEYLNICRSCKCELTKKTQSKGKICKRCTKKKINERAEKKSKYLEEWFFGSEDDYNWYAWHHYKSWGK